MRAITPQVTWVRCRPVILKNDAPNNPVPHGFLKQRHAFTNQREPFPNMQQSKQNAGRRGDHASIEKLPPCLPPWLPATPSSMVKLLVRRMKVISATLVMLWKGLRPVGSAIAQEPVGHQAGGKGHGVGDDEQPHRQLFRGNRKRRLPAIRPECPSMVRSAWLTAPPSSFSRLKLHPKQQQQVHPKHIHEMPVARGRI